MHDELAYAIRYKLFQDASRETYTARNDRSQTALPIRQFGSFLPGEGLGGAGAHWNGDLGEFVLPWDDVRTAGDPHAAALAFTREAFQHACSVCDWDPALAATAVGTPPPVR